MTLDSHDHADEVAMFGECITCARASVTPQTAQGPLFDGQTYQPAQDSERLSGQLGAVYEALSDAQWWTLAALAERAGASEASVSARLRDLRKPRFGGHVIDRRRCSPALFEYRLSPQLCPQPVDNPEG